MALKQYSCPRCQTLSYRYRTTRYDYVRQRRISIWRTYCCNAELPPRPQGKTPPGCQHAAAEKLEDYGEYGETIGTDYQWCPQCGSLANRGRWRKPDGETRTDVQNDQPLRSD